MINHRCLPVAQRTFLGYTIHSTGTLLIAKDSIKRVKETIKRITRRTRGIALNAVINELNQKLIGWVRYFKLAQAKSWMNKFDEKIRRRLRCYKLKQLKRASAIVKFFRTRHIPENKAWLIAGSGKGPWRLSKTWQTHRVMSNGWFEMEGLKSLEKAYLAL